MLGLAFHTSRGVGGATTAASAHSAGMATSAARRRSRRRDVRALQSASPQANNGPSGPRASPLAMAHLAGRMLARPAVEIVDMILDVAAMAPEHGPFAAGAQLAQQARRQRQIGGGLVGGEEGRA